MSRGLIKLFGEEKRQPQNELFTLDGICDVGSEENMRFTEFLVSELGM